MLQISAQVLAMSSEHTVLEKNGKVAFANASARLLLGEDCLGKSIVNLFGEELAGVQAASFIGDFDIGGKRYIVRVCSMDGMRAFFISPSEHTPSLISDAFVFSLRNCLMNIDITMSRLYSKDELTPEMSECFAGLSHESFKINRILSNISIIRSIWDDALVFSPVYMDISAHVEELVRSLSILLPEPKLQYKNPGPLFLYADPSLLDTLLLNLISNAISHGKTCSRISIAINRLKDRVVLSVDDDGCGIPAEAMHNVFDRYRHGIELGNMDHGAGLGLTAVRLIAATHGGILLLESRENQGTAVRVSLDTSPKAMPAKQPLPQYEKSMSSLLTGLAGCLPAELFTEKYIG